MSIVDVVPAVTPGPDHGQGTSGPVANAVRVTRKSLRSATAQILAKPVNSAATIGRGVGLTVSLLRYSIQDAFTLRLSIAEVLAQAWTLLKVTAVPALLMAIPFGAIITVQTSGLVNQVGASSLVGAASGLGVIRQGAPMAAGLLMGGAAASAIASDLGARAIREELDALRVIGVDPVRYLAMPRFLALLMIAPILCALIIGAAVGASYLFAVLFSDVSSGSFWMSFGAFTRPIDVWLTIGKSVLFGGIVAVISCLRGMEAKGGPRGVADAVNSSVVLNVLAIAVVNLMLTQLQAMFFPMAVA